jgi:protein-S-isoprenylcysteine O-methyltransferase Ste14
MTEPVRLSLICIGLSLLAVGSYHRVQSQRSGERLDRTKEGWPILIGIRLVGLLTLGTAVAWLWNPARFAWATVPVAEWARWMGVAGFAASAVWLAWMFVTLGRNLTDTVVTRRDATLVDSGPYRWVRNPMYTGALGVGMSLGLALGTWSLPLGSGVVFTLLAVRTRTEERYLIERFGDRYRAYMARVGRFIPRLSTR